MTTTKTRNLHFDISSGLKTVLGSELITNDEVAIFELVKNSFDAGARHVHIFFGDDTIIVSDDGHGMSYEDIRDKWLFVAYSSKREANRDEGFRDDVLERKQLAGSKGIGRFSSDRLGEIIVLQTKPKHKKSEPVHRVTVNWERFDKDHKKHFDHIKVAYQEQRRGFELPDQLPNLRYGTAIEIKKVRRNWDRESIIRLKSELAKLINPFGADVDGFRITVHSPSELAEDAAQKKLAKNKDEEIPPNRLVNGDVGNFIFATLKEKTTFIDVRLDDTGRFIESTLTDRGELIYRIKEPNPYKLLIGSEFRCQVFFLNQSAKLTFARRMGVQSVRFGSVFLFRNGFRIFPIGNEGDDWFGMDRRKQQGYARFLGTRDVIGRIDVAGKEGDFEEASSRDTGLINTPAVEELRKCFREHCLIRLERYVVPVTFVDKEDKNLGDVSRLMTDPGRARVASAVAKIVDNENIELVDYSKRLIGILNERSEQFEESLTSLRSIAEKTADKKLFRNIEKAERRFKQLKSAEEAARQQADEERKAKEEAQERADTAERVASAVIEELDEERKRNLFLSSISTLDTDTILNLHHQVTIYAVDIQQQIENFLVEIAGKKSVSHSDIIDAFEGIALLNRKVMEISKFATKANFRLESEKIEADIGEYIEQYINDITKEFLYGPANIDVRNDGKMVIQKFKPIDISIVIDNLVSNARKARASTIAFDIQHPTTSSTHIYIQDNGRGFDNRIKDLDRVFDKGFTMTDGSGLGLYHIRHVLGEMNGTIEATTNSERGAAFLIRIAK